MLDGSTMKQEPDYGLQAAHMLISELMGARLELVTRALALEARLRAAEERIAELTRPAGPMPEAPT